MVKLTALLLFVGGCAPNTSGGGGGGGGDGSSGGTPPPISAVVGASGGSYASAGFKVDVPAGALTQDVTLSITPLTASTMPGVSPTTRALIAGADFGPDGTTFSSPITITIPLAVALTPGDVYDLYYYDTTISLWKYEGVGATVASDGLSLTAPVTHFTGLTIFGRESALPHFTDISPADGATDIPLDYALRLRIASLSGDALQAALAALNVTIDGQPAIINGVVQDGFEVVQDDHNNLLIIQTADFPAGTPISETMNFTHDGNLFTEVVTFTTVSSHPDPTHYIETPAAPNGYDIGDLEIFYSFAISTVSCTLGHSIMYQIDYDDDYITGWYHYDDPMFANEMAYAWSTSGIKNVRVKAKCTVESDWSEPHPINILDLETISIPDTPATDVDTGDPGGLFVFTIGGAESNLFHEVEYQVDWFDGTPKVWQDAAGPWTHAWASTGVYLVKAKARCKTHTPRWSDWSTIKEILM